MKKQPVWEKKNREAGGSSPEKRRRRVAKRRLAQTEIRHAHFGVEISGLSICAVIRADFGRDTAHENSGAYLELGFSTNLSEFSLRMTFWKI